MGLAQGFLLSWQAVYKVSMTDYDEEILNLAPERSAAITGEIWTNTMMDKETVKACNTAFFAANTAAAAPGEFLLAYLLACADQGSSQATALQGQNQTVPFSAMSAHIIRSYGTTRQYCMYYAKVVWNALLKAKRAPASWQKRHFDRANRFAAFDFFQGVANEGGLMPKEGLVRMPTEGEILANEANREIAITLSQSQPRFTTHGQVAVREQQSIAAAGPRLLM